MKDTINLYSFCKIYKYNDKNNNIKFHSQNIKKHIHISMFHYYIILNYFINKRGNWNWNFRYMLSKNNGTLSKFDFNYQKNMHYISNSCFKVFYYQNLNNLNTHSSKSHCKLNTNNGIKRIMLYYYHKIFLDINISSVNLKFAFI